MVFGKKKRNAAADKAIAASDWVKNIALDVAMEGAKGNDPMEMLQSHPEMLGVAHGIIRQVELTGKAAEAMGSEDFRPLLIAHLMKGIIDRIDEIKELGESK